uniref:Uncharacterized protein n=1 Tax=Arundo donax TaxID=35708 RepID=A0A0A9FYL2_ARUDO
MPSEDPLSRGHCVVISRRAHRRQLGLEGILIVGVPEPFCNLVVRRRIGISRAAS